MGEQRAWLPGTAAEVRQARAKAITRSTIHDSHRCQFPVALSQASFPAQGKGVGQGARGDSEGPGSKAYDPRRIRNGGDAAAHRRVPEAPPAMAQSGSPGKRLRTC